MFIFDLVGFKFNLLLIMVKLIWEFIAFNPLVKEFFNLMLVFN